MLSFLNERVQNVQSAVSNNVTDKLKQVSKDRHSCLLVDHDEAVAVLTVFRDLGLCLVTTACDIIDMVKAINACQ